MSMKIINSLFILLVISIFLSLFKLGKYPAAFNRDELAIGYNAYSVLETGRDEHGVKYPLSFQSFNDYKLPGLIYLNLLSIKLFGPNPFAIRFPTALIASFTPFLFAFFIYLETKNKKLSLLSGILTLISPWYFFNSRTSLEGITAQTFILLALVFLHHGRKKSALVFFSITLFALSCFIYNAPFFLALPILITYLFLYRKDFFKNRTSTLSSIFSILFLAAFLIFYYYLFEAIYSGKTSTTILDQDYIKIQSDLRFHQLKHLGLPIPILNIFINQKLIILQKFIQQYIKIFNLNFLFLEGGLNPWRDMNELGFAHFYLLFAPLLILGIYQLFKNYKKYKFLVLLIFITPAVSAITIDSPVTNRLLDFLLIVTFVVSLGLHTIFTHFNKLRLKPVNTTVGFLIAITFISYLYNFFFVFPHNMPTQWHPFSQKIVSFISEHQDSYEAIYIDEDNLGHGYIYFAFFTPFDPSNFQQKAKWLNNERVIKYNKYIFDSVNDDKLNNILNEVDGKILLVNKKPYRYDVLKTFNNSQGKLEWVIEELEEL